MKKIISMLLVCVMVLGLFAFGASAEAEDTIVIMAPRYRQLPGKPGDLESRF